jgi:hypothetical protein
LTVFKRIFFFVAILLILLICAFFAIGGVQFLRVSVLGPRLPPTPSAPTPASDLTYLAAAVLANERGPELEAFQRFEQIINRAQPPQTSDDLSLIASQAEAVLGNAHSTLFSPAMRQVPVRLHWLSDGLIVVKADHEHGDLPGRRILTIGRRRPEELLEGMKKFVGGGTPAWVRYRSEYFLTARSVLTALGAVVDGDVVEFELVDASGVKTTARLASDEAVAPGNPFGDWRHALPGDTHYGTKGWSTLLSSSQALPVYQQEATQSLWLHDLKSNDALYIRLNGSLNAETETLAKFAERVTTAMRRDRRPNVILDLRYDWGGDYTLSLPLVKGIASALSPGGRIYMITGPNTFSAGLITATQMKRFAPPGSLTIIGDDVGDTLRFRAEGFDITLPATKIEVYVPSAWDDVGKGCGLFDDCWPPNKFLLKGVGTLEPDIRVANDWASYREGRDLVVDAILSDIANRSTGRR